MRNFLFTVVVILALVLPAHADDMLLNLRDPAATSSFTPTLRVDGKADNSTNPTVKLPALTCVATAVAPVYTEGALVPCSTDLAGTLRSTVGAAAGTSSTFGAAFPATGTAAGYNDGTNMQGARVYDVDSGGGTEYTLGSTLRCVAAGGSTACLPPTFTSADGIANQVASVIHTFLYGYNGATWDRINSSISSNPSATSSGLVTRSFEIGAATSTLTNVSDTAVSTTLLASNASRLGATIYNDSTETLFVKFGAAASSSSFTAKVFPDGYFEIPKRYTGIIDGIWAADAAGAARMTELTP